MKTKIAILTALCGASLLVLAQTGGNGGMGSDDNSTYHNHNMNNRTNSWNDGGTNHWNRGRTNRWSGSNTNWSGGETNHHHWWQKKD